MDKSETDIITKWRNVLTLQVKEFTGFIRRYVDGMSNENASEFVDLIDNTEHHPAPDKVVGLMSMCDMTPNIPADERTKIELMGMDIIDLMFIDEGE